MRERYVEQVRLLMRLLPAIAAEEVFGFAEMPVLAFEDLFAGKLHAALDRQHPRDLYDVHLLYEDEGLTDERITFHLGSAPLSHRCLDPAPHVLATSENGPPCVSYVPATARPCRQPFGES